MAFTKSFRKKTDKLSIPTWVDVTLSEEEEKAVEEKARQENIILMKQCIDDAKQILIEKNMNERDSDLLTVAIALFEKRASHSIYWKENRAKEKV